MELHLPGTASKSCFNCSELIVNRSAMDLNTLARAAPSVTRGRFFLSSSFCWGVALAASWSDDSDGKDLWVAWAHSLYLNQSITLWKSLVSSLLDKGLLLKKLKSNSNLPSLGRVHKGSQRNLTVLYISFLKQDLLPSLERSARVPATIASKFSLFMTTKSWANSLWKGLPKLRL